jgi:predicted metal-dependent HD superfamily phosphohydrolase
MKEKFISILNSISNEINLIEDLYSRLHTIYTEENRFYHSLDHINNIIEDLDSKWEKYTLLELLGNSFPSSEMKKDTLYTNLYLATWFHDSIINIGSNTNEIDSADLAACELQKINFPEKQIKSICELILSTISHRPIFDNGVCKIFLDLDLAILGKDAKTYEKYCKNIRKEFSHIEQNVYSEKRVKILSNFLKRDKLFFTSEFQEQYEVQARKNIKQEIQQLLPI